jgi:hypothetical protein
MDSTLDVKSESYCFVQAMLYLLGHNKLAIDDWISARKLFNQDLIGIVSSLLYIHGILMDLLMS